MTPPAQPTAAQTSERAHAGIQAISSAGATAIDLALLVQFWGQWRAVATIAVVAVVMALSNLGPIEWLARWSGRSAAENVRAAMNASGIIAVGYATSWTALSWAFVPYLLLWFFGLDDKGLPRMFAYLVLINTVALWTGSSVELALAFSLISVFGYLLLDKRNQALLESLRRTIAQREQLEQTHQRLERMHQRALEQEKLTSLGMMAAGVAHEINNPMSFVTSNINLLLKDLRRQPALPPSLKEYVDEVLPETLEGIRRVNAIMSDLRQFSRGDPEAQAEYDLNTQAEAALRIAHGQLRHCEVQAELGELRRLWGRPQQIIQALVNLLINAGQATPPGGQVKLLTRQEGAEVRVDVRDTGEGMSPETMRNLFQPFFTTRAPGTGVGLGLAVVHGVVTAHGGRIAVQSQPGQGSCFTLYLPVKG